MYLLCLRLEKFHDAELTPILTKVKQNIDILSIKLNHLIHLPLNNNRLYYIKLDTSALYRIIFSASTKVNCYVM